MDNNEKDSENIPMHTFLDGDDYYDYHDSVADKYDNNSYIRYDEYGNIIHDDNVAETRFTTESLPELVDLIEDESIRSDVENEVDNISQLDWDDYEDPNENIEKIKQAILNAIDKKRGNLVDNGLDLESWDKLVLINEHEKFLWEQQIKIFNTLLSELPENKTVFIDDKNKTVYEFIKEHVVETRSEKRDEVNGFTFDGHRIIGRNRSKAFYLDENEHLFEFIEKVRSIQSRSCRSILSELINYSDKVEDVAIEYIDELENEQRRLIESSGTSTNRLRESILELNAIERDIENVRKNRPIRVRMKVFRNTLSSFLGNLSRYIYRFIARDKGKIGVFLISVLSTVVTAFAETISFENALNAGSAALGRAGKKILDNITNTLNNIIDEKNTSIKRSKLFGIVVGAATVLFGIFYQSQKWGIILLMVLTIYILSFIDFATLQVEDKTKILKYIGYKMLEESYLQMGRLPNVDTTHEIAKLENVDVYTSPQNKLVANPTTWNEILSVGLKMFGNVFIAMSYVSDGIVYTVYSMHKIPFVVVLIALVLFISVIMNNGT